MGHIKLGSEEFEGTFSFIDRFAEKHGETNPEELLGGALAASFTASLNKILTKAGFRPNSLRATVRVRIDSVGRDLEISKINLSLEADVPGLSEVDLENYARQARQKCPVSNALGGTEIDVELI